LTATVQLFSFQYPFRGARCTLCSLSNRLSAVTTVSGRLRSCSATRSNVCRVFTVSGVYHHACTLHEANRHDGNRLSNHHRRCQRKSRGRNVKGETNSFAVNLHGRMPHGWVPRTLLGESLGLQRTPNTIFISLGNGCPRLCFAP
jgi:hypothetical protein